MNRCLKLLVGLALLWPTMALAMPQETTTEQLSVTVYSDANALREALEHALARDGVAVGALAGEDGMLKLYFWEQKSKRPGAEPPAVTLTIPGVVAAVPLQPLSHVERANMFELAVHRDRLNTAYFVIQARVNKPARGDFAWRGVFQLKGVPTKPATATE